MVILYELKWARRSMCLCIYMWVPEWTSSMREWIQSIRWINIYCYKFYMHVWLTNLFSMANVRAIFSVGFSCYAFAPECEFTRKWIGIDYKFTYYDVIFGYYRIVVAGVAHFICFFCPAKGYLNNKSKCHWPNVRMWMCVYVYMWPKKTDTKWMNK